MASKYEKLREINIRRNQDFLQSLGIDLVALKTKPSYSRKRLTSATSADDSATRRKSARLKKVASVSVDTSDDIQPTAARVIDGHKVSIVRKRITAEVLPIYVTSLFPLFLQN